MLSLKTFRRHRRSTSFIRTAGLFLMLIALLGGSRPAARAEAMLQLFNVNWDELTQKIPEIAEAGYTSLWLPPPAKAGSVFSVGYDLFDPFDLGDLNQRGTVRTRYGTKAELQQLVATAHRFGIRVYFDNIMNHRGFDVPRYTLSTPTNLYPGLTIEDFHVRRQADGTYRNWDPVNNYNSLFEVQNRPLFGLLDLANEPGSVNNNFGLNEGNTTNKVSFLRQPGFPHYYMDTNLPAINGPWRPFNSTNGDPVIEDLGSYLIRSAMWIMAETRCDGFRLDAVKHTPATFFGDTTATPFGYLGGIQTMFDHVHGYGTNTTGYGYEEGDDNRNSCFDTEAPRNDALLFGEHLGEPPSFQEYLDRGMRLLNTPYHFEFNNKFGNPGGTLAGLDQRDYEPYPSAFPGAQSVLFAQSHDDNISIRRELHNAYNFFREGLPSIYSDGYNESGAPDYFPKIASAPYLGQFGDPKMPELAYLHHQLSRGGTRPRWSDADIAAFERYDYRESGSAADQTVVLFAMNDNYGFPGDIAFVDGEGETFPAGVNKPPGTGGDAQGIAVSFPPGSVLVQLATSTPGYDRTYKKATVRPATNSRAAASGSGGSTVYVGGQTIPVGGGAIEILVPSGGYVAYGYQWPEASKANNRRDVIQFRQNGASPLRVTTCRRDGLNGDTNFLPAYPFKMRGSVDDQGNLITGVNVSNKTYAIDIPVLTNANFDIFFETDSSANNLLAKLDGGIDLNSHLNLGSTHLDKRDNRPGEATDVFLGYEQTAFVSRYGAEKFAAQATNRNNTVSDGAETYHYTVGTTNTLIVNGTGNDWTLTVGTAAWATHNPGTTNGYVGAGGGTQRSPLNPTAGQAVDIHVRAGFQFQVSRCLVYYTTDGTNPEGAFGVGRGTTKVVSGSFVNDDAIDGNIDWWKATIPAVDNTGGAQIRYKIALFNDSIQPIGDNLDVKRFGRTTFAITNFNPTSATVWLHNNRNTNDVVTGLQEGYHIVRARAFLPRTNKSSVFNTFAQTFYYDAAPPAAAVALPNTNNATIFNAVYQIAVRTDATATGVEINIADSIASNDDAQTGLNNGNGNTNGVPVFVAATEVTPNATLNVQFPNLPREWRFTYYGVPNSGTANITARVKEATTAVYSNRVTTVVRTVNTAAPARILYISQPAANGTINLATTNSTVNVFVCNTTVNPETAQLTNYTLKVNGVTVNSTNFIFGTSPTCGPGYNSLFYRWGNIPAGTNVLEATFNGTVVLNDTRTVNAVYPPPPTLDTDGDGMTDAAEAIAGTNPNDPASALRITGLEDGSQLVVWDSVPGINYQVLATTNFALPLEPVSPTIQASGSTTFYYDTTPAADQKYYRIQVMP